MGARAGRPSKPPGSEYPQDVAVSKQRCIALQRTQSRDHTIDASANLLGSFAARTAAIAEDRPSRAVSVNLLRRQSFVRAVVPLHQIRIDLGTRSQARHLTGLPRSSQRTRQHQLEIRRGQLRPQQSRLLTTVLGQRNVGDTRVLTTETPFG